MNNKIILIYNDNYTQSIIYIKLGNTIRLPSYLVSKTLTNAVTNKFGWIYIRPNNKLLGNFDTIYTEGDFWLGVNLEASKKPMHLKDIYPNLECSFNLFDRNEIDKGCETQRNLETGEEYQIEGSLENILDKIGLNRNIIGRCTNWIEYE